MLPHQHLLHPTPHAVACIWLIKLALWACELRRYTEHLSLILWCCRLEIFYIFILEFLFCKKIPWDNGTYTEERCDREQQASVWVQAGEHHSQWAAGTLNSLPGYLVCVPRLVEGTTGYPGVVRAKSQVQIGGNNGGGSSRSSSGGSSHNLQYPYKY